MHTSRNHKTRPEPRMLSRPPARNLDSRLSAQANHRGINLSQTGRRMGRRTPAGGEGLYTWKTVQTTLFQVWRACALRLCSMINVD